MGLTIRLYGLNWDQNQHLHPDERFLTMVGTTIQLPSSLINYFDTAASPLNPYNYKDYQFFVYGTFPLFLTKAIAVAINYDTYGLFNLLGRSLSDFFDSLTILVLFFIARSVIRTTKKWLYLLPSLFYALAVLPIQLSHFFTVDTFLNFFLVSTFLFLTKKRYALASLCYGLALASKISAAYFAPIFGLFILIDFLNQPTFLKKIFFALKTGSICLVLTFAAFRIFQPYSFVGLFQPNPQFLANLQTLEAYNRPDGYYPPGVQWLSITPLLFPLKNIVFWGIGLPLTIIFFMGIISYFFIQRLSFISFIKRSPLPILLSIFWIILLFVYQGLQFAPTMRYFVIIYPFIFLVAAYFLSHLSIKLVLPFLGLHLIYAASFLAIYTVPQSRVQASSWIYQNIPSGSTFTNEYWDDPLPLYLPGSDPNIYHGIMISPYDPDSPTKWQTLTTQFNQSQYLIMSSNRLWGSISRVPDRYPQTAAFYRQLFDNDTDFKFLKQIVSYPGFHLSFLHACYYFGPTNYPYFRGENHWFDIDPTCQYPGIYLRDDTAEEAFTVYDHPQVLIFTSNQKR